MRIKLSRGATINMGNYQSYRFDESYRFDVGIEEDFDRVPLADAWNVLTGKVDILFQKEMEEAKKQAK